MVELGGKMVSPTVTRVPAQAVDVEEQVLGACLYDPTAFVKVLSVLTAERFYSTAHQRIFAAMCTCFENCKPIDTITVGEELKKSGQLDQVGGESVLAGLSMCVTSGANAEHHALIVLEKSVLRQLYVASTEIAQCTFDPSVNPFELMDKASQSVYEIMSGTMKTSYRPLKDVIITTLEECEALHGSPNGITGVASGFRDLDQLTGGWQKSDLIIVAGRPSSGKTAFGLSVGLFAPVPVGIFSLEMASRQLASRLMCADARVDGHKLRTGTLSETD